MTNGEIVLAGKDGNGKCAITYKLANKGRHTANKAVPDESDNENEAKRKWDSTQ